MQSPSPTRETRVLLRHARAVLAEHAAAESVVRKTAEQSVALRVSETLHAMPLESLRDRIGTRIAWSALEAAGYHTVESVLYARPAALEAIHGIGPVSVAALQTVASQVRHELMRTTAPLISTEGDPVSRTMVTALHGVDSLRMRDRTLLPAAQRLTSTAPELLARAEPMRALLLALVREAVWSPTVRRLAHPMLHGNVQQVRQQGIQGLLGLLAETQVQAFREAMGGGNRALPTAHPEVAWAAYEADPARFTSLLDDVMGSSPAWCGNLDASLVSAIQGTPLNTSGLTVTLRRYQAFGARFVLSQRRVLLGDEMGLGKTLQAIAVMSHLASEAKTLTPDRPLHMLVVAPASVLVNWDREIRTKSDLATHLLHATDRDARRARWIAQGGVAVTTFEQAVQLADVPNLPNLDLLVVDEAHYAKNPEAQRSQAVRVFAERAHRLMLMTGTPIENRGTEFVELVSLLNPKVAQDLLAAPDAVISPTAFRAIVGPLYLRRNAVDVLGELPELVEMQDWQPMTPDDQRQYAAAVRSGNPMLERRATWLAPTVGGQSAKLNRLTEIVAQAKDAGARVIVYSQFLDVLNTVQGALGSAAYGPLTGAMPPAKRQELIDEYSNGPAGSVLVSQIVAGGVGLNIQSANVIVLCEPQVKPSVEAQAIKRAHRMGQVRTVRVYRLLSPDTIDEDMVALLADKQETFDAYARDSMLAAAAGRP